ncbi:type IV pilin N-terminal domain-containing protein [Methanoculleus palmolei]|uniref:Type IV pilin N-terminal domain-containing protein n=1 Tax=Methanoculleus palmolei TaxID=72612 RepID=A0ABD8A7K5_9EURY|nr:type IV pilin N-terminal domain-containing protein [Methanoculleus palmolei]
MKHLLTKDEAVSPVIGVMLMLVVTIIIAAVVSAFAGGMTGDVQKAPQASVVPTEFVVKGVIDTDATSAFGQGIAQPDQGTGAAADIYVIFEHKGGDPLNLDMVELRLGKLSEPQVSSLISRALTPQTGSALVTSQGNFGTIGDKSLIPGWSAGWDKYLEKYSDRENIVIAPGDRFVLHADYGAKTGSQYISWHQEGGAYPFPIKQGDVLTYDLIDKNSRKVISSGQIPVPEFTVATS